MSTSTPKPFTLHVPDAEIAELRQRLARTRWPDEPPCEPWSTGTSLEYLRGLVGRWKDHFDWRTHEARINALRQYTVSVRGIDLHFVHQAGAKHRQNAGVDGRVQFRAGDIEPEDLWQRFHFGVRSPCRPLRLPGTERLARQLKNLHRVCQPLDRKLPQGVDLDQALGQSQGGGQPNTARGGELLH